MRITKIFFLCLCLLLLHTYTACAAPSVTANKTTFDILTGTYKLNGDVCVKTSRFTVNADKAQVSLASFEVWAQGNINCHYNAEDTLPAIDFTGQDLYGSWNSKTITVKGGTTFKCGDLTIKAAQTSFNWETKLADFSGGVTVEQNGKTSHYQEIKYNIVEKQFINDQTAPTNTTANQVVCTGDTCSVAQ